MSEIVTTGGGNKSVSVYQDHSTVYAGNGNDTIKVHGKDSFVLLGSGHDKVYMYQGGEVVELGAKGHDTINWGSKPLDVRVDGHATVYGSESQNKFHLGLATIHGGEFKVNYADGKLTEIAVSGKMTLHGGRAPTEFIAGKDTTVKMIGNHASDTFIGGSGHDTMTGGTKANLFEFLGSEKGGHHVITNFVHGDKLYIEGHSLHYLESHHDVHEHGGNTYIDIDGGKTTIELKGFTDLKGSDIKHS